MPHPKVKLSDDSGNAVSVTSNRLDVNAYLSATPTIDIGDVSLLLGGTAASVNNGEADATTLRVTVASDSTGVLSIDDNGGSITVDGTVTANLSATDNAVLDNILTKNTEIDAVLDTIKIDTEAIETAVELLDNAIDGSEMQVDIVSSATLTVDGSGVTQPISGTITANLSATDNAVLDSILIDTSAIKTAVQILDDWDDSNYANVNINLAGSDAPTGGGAESGALRVTLANDSTGVITVDGTVTANLSATDNAVLDAMVVDLATIEVQLGLALTDLAAMEALLITIDADTNIIKGGYHQVTTAAGSSDVGVPAVTVRNDTLAMDGNFSGHSDGDYTNIQTSSIGAIYTTGAEVENGAVQSQPSLIGGRYDSSARTLDSGDAGAVALNASGHVLSELAASTAAIGKLAANSGVDIGDVDVTSLPASTNTIEVVGDVAENANAAGNPVLVGGRYDSSARTLGDTDVGAIALNDKAYVKIDWEGDITETSSVISAVQTGYGGSDRNFQVAPTIRNDTLAALTNSTDGDWSPMQVDALGALYTTHGITGGADGIKVVTTAGTDVELASSTACKKVDIQAQTDNTGLIAVGFTGVDATEATGTGVILYAGDTYSLEINNLNLIYIDSTVSGEGVRYTYFT